MVGDTHFGVFPLNLNKWVKIQFDYFYKQLIPYLKKHVKEGDILIHGGDLFDNRTSVPIIVQNKVEQLLIDIGEILPVHIIVGNHDLWNKGDNSINSPKIYNWLPNVNVYEKTTIIEKCDKKLVLMPWVEKKPDMIKEIDNNPGDYLFCHSDLNGCLMHLSSVAHRNKDKIDVEEFGRYKRVFSGHIHIRQVHKNFEFIGAPYQMDRNDYNDKKGLTILNLETGETEFVENNVSPTFKKIKISSDGDLLLLEHLNTDNHFVDLEINNSVLVGKRKNRKVLEKLLTQKNFAKIDYIDDLSKKKKEDEKGLTNVEVSLDDLKLDDFSEVIIKYTKSQEYQNETMKNGVLDEMDKIIKIYNKEHKFKKDDDR